jgi:hypothetical protein
LKCFFAACLKNKKPAYAGFSIQWFCCPFMLVHTNAKPRYCLGSNSSNMNECKSLPIYFATIIRIIILILNPDEKIKDRLKKMNFYGVEKT